MNKSILAVLMLALMPAGCATQSTNPYATQSPIDRDSLRAQKLTQDAAKLINTKPDKAEKLLREALTADIYHGPAHNNLGVLYLNQDRLYEAAGEFEWAGKLMPGHPDPRMNLALALERAGRIDDAMANYETALEVYPNHVATTQALVRLQLRYGRTDERTHEFLEQIAFQGEDSEWREWAREQLVLYRP